MPDPRTRQLAVAHCEAAAQIIRELLIERDAYKGHPKRMMSPAMLAYFVGWNEGAMRKAGLEPESEEGLDVLGNMLWVIFDASLVPEWVSTSRIANAYYDFRRAVLRKEAAVQEAYRVGARDFASYRETGSRPARLADLLKARREPADRTPQARRA